MSCKLAELQLQHSACVGLGPGLTPAALLLQLAKLRKTVETVRAENVQYRASNKTEEFEQRIAAMQKQIEKTGEHHLRV